METGCHQKRASPKGKQLTFLQINAFDADVIVDEPLFHQEKLVGYVTFKRSAHASNLSVAAGFVLS